jgi:hypothetical protein
LREYEEEVPQERLDEFLDELLPEDLDWKRLVSSYPKSALAVAALAGFAFGRSRGAAVLGGLAAFAADGVGKAVNEFLGEEIV